MSPSPPGPPPTGIPVLTGLESAWARVDGYRLHYWLGGPPDGEPVVLWHGFLGTGWSWREVAPALAASGHRVLVVDMLGFGDSDKPEGVDAYAGGALAEQVRALASQLDLRRPVVVAHDMGAPPALLWAAHHPDEVAALVYVEAPTMLGGPLREILAYTPDTMAQGSMWWWILPLAPGVPEALVVGRERAFLDWFYDGAAGAPAAFPDDVRAEVMRTFGGTVGVLGAMGVYRAAFQTIDQTEPLTASPVTVPVVSVAGERGLGDQVATLLRPVVTDLTSHVVRGCGHFVAEEAPEQLLEIVRRTVGRVRDRPAPSTHT